MAEDFDILARVQLQGPSQADLAAVARQIKGGIGQSISVSVDRSSAAAAGKLRGEVDNLSQAAARASANATTASASVRGLSQAFGVGVRPMGGFQSGVDGAAKSMRAMRTEADAASTSMDRFGGQIGLTARRFLAFTVAAGTMVKLAATVREGVSEAVLFEKEMVKVAQVSGDSDRAISKLQGRISGLATGLGVSSRGLAEVSVLLKQAGLDLKETEALLGTIAKADLAPNFDSMTETTEGLIAVMQQFKLEGKELQAAIGGMNAVAGGFAVEAQDLIEVVRKAGGAFAQTGGDVQQLISLFTSVRATTRESADAISTGLRTIFTRLQRQGTVDALKDLRINLRYTREEARALGDLGLQDQFVGAYEAVRRLSEGLGRIRTTDPRFAAAIEELGGYRQVSRVIPLLKEFRTTQDALNAARAGSISIDLAAEKGQESLANRLDKTTEKLQELFRTVVGSDAFQGMARNLLSLTDALVAVAEAAEPLLPILASIATVKLGQGLGALFRQGPSGFVGKKFAGGGFVPGSGDGDTVNAWLEPGEFVVRKRAVKAIESARPGFLNQLNREAPRFATGGPVRRHSDAAFDYLQQNLETAGIRGIDPRKLASRVLVVRSDTPRNIMNMGGFYERGSGVAVVREDILEEGLSHEVLGHGGVQRYANLNISRRGWLRNGRTAIERLGGGKDARAIFQATGRQDYYRNRKAYLTDAEFDEEIGEERLATATGLLVAEKLRAAGHRHRSYAPDRFLEETTKRGHFRPFESHYLSLLRRMTGPKTGPFDLPGVLPEGMEDLWERERLAYESKFSPYLVSPAHFAAGGSVLPPPRLQSHSNRGLTQYEDYLRRLDIPGVQPQKLTSGLYFVGSRAPSSVLPPGAAAGFNPDSKLTVAGPLARQNARTDFLSHEILGHGASARFAAPKGERSGIGTAVRGSTFQKLGNYAFDDYFERSVGTNRFIKYLHYYGQDPVHGDALLAEEALATAVGDFALDRASRRGLASLTDDQQKLFGKSKTRKLFRGIESSLLPKLRDITADNTPPLSFDIAARDEKLGLLSPYLSRVPKFASGGPVDPARLARRHSNRNFAALEDIMYLIGYRGVDLRKLATRIYTVRSADEVGGVGRNNLTFSAGSRFLSSASTILGRLLGEGAFHRTQTAIFSGTEGEQLRRLIANENVFADTYPRFVAAGGTQGLHTAHLLTSAAGSAVRRRLEGVGIAPPGPRSATWDRFLDFVDNAYIPVVGEISQDLPPFGQSDRGLARSVDTMMGFGGRNRPLSRPAHLLETANELRARRGLPRRFASGGPASPIFISGDTAPGSGTGDKVPALVTPGEFIFSKEATEAIGEDRLRFLNGLGSGIQKFARGGVVMGNRPQRFANGDAVLRQVFLGEVGDKQFQADAARQAKALGLTIGETTKGLAFFNSKGVPIFVEFVDKMGHTVQDLSKAAKEAELTVKSLQRTRQETQQPRTGRAASLFGDRMKRAKGDTIVTTEIPDAELALRKFEAASQEIRLAAEQGAVRFEQNLPPLSESDPVTKAIRSGITAGQLRKDPTGVAKRLGLSPAQLVDLQRRSGEIKRIQVGTDVAVQAEKALSAESTAERIERERREQAKTVKGVFTIHERKFLEELEKDPARKARVEGTYRANEEKFGAFIGSIGAQRVSDPRLRDEFKSRAYLNVLKSIDSYDPDNAGGASLDTYVHGTRNPTTGRAGGLLGFADSFVKQLYDERSQYRNEMVRGGGAAQEVASAKQVADQARDEISDAMDRITGADEEVRKRGGGRGPGVIYSSDVSGGAVDPLYEKARKEEEKRDRQKRKEEEAEERRVREHSKRQAAYEKEQRERLAAERAQKEAQKQAAEATQQKAARTVSRPTAVPEGMVARGNVPPIPPPPPSAPPGAAGDDDPRKKKRKVARSSVPVFREADLLPFESPQTGPYGTYGLNYGYQAAGQPRRMTPDFFEFPDSGGGADRGHVSKKFVEKFLEDERKPVVVPKDFLSPIPLPRSSDDQDLVTALGSVLSPEAEGRERERREREARIEARRQQRVGVVGAPVEDATGVGVNVVQARIRQRTRRQQDSLSANLRAPGDFVSLEDQDRILEQELQARAQREVQASLASPITPEQARAGRVRTAKEREAVEQAGRTGHIPISATTGGPNITDPLAIRRHVLDAQKRYGAGANALDYFERQGALAGFSETQLKVLRKQVYTMTPPDLRPDLPGGGPPSGDLRHGPGGVVPPILPSITPSTKDAVPHPAGILSGSASIPDEAGRALANKQAILEALQRDPAEARRLFEQAVAAGDLGREGGATRKFLEKRLQLGSGGGGGVRPPIPSPADPNDPNYVRSRNTGLNRTGLQSLAKQRGENEIRRRGGEELFSRVGQEEIYEKQEAKLQQELVRAQQRLIQAIHPSISATEAKRLAEQQAADALTENARVVRRANGAIVGLEAQVKQAQQRGVTPPALTGFGKFTQGARGYYDRAAGFASRATGAVGNLGRRFNNSAFGRAVGGGFIGNAATGLLFALPIIDQGLQKFGGTAERAVTGGSGRFKFAKGASGALSSALAGGVAGGAIAGPIGAAFGAVAAGAFGLVSSLKEAEREIRAVKLDRAFETLDDRLQRLGNLGEDAGPGVLNQISREINVVRRETRAQNRADATGFFSGFDAEAFAASENRSERENFGPRLNQFFGVLGKEAERIGRAGVGKKIDDLVKELESGNQGLNREFLQIIADVRGVSLDEVLGDFKKDLVNAQSAEKVRRELASSNRIEQRGATSGARLVQSLEGALAGGQGGRNRLSLLAQSFGGPSTLPLTTDPTGLQRLTGPDAMRSLRLVSAVGGAGGQSLLERGQAAQQIARVLPGVLSESRTRNFEEGADLVGSVRSGLVTSLGFKSLDDLPDELFKAVTSATTQLAAKAEGDLGATQQAIGDDAGRFADELTAAYADPVREAGVAAARAIEENANEFGEALSRYQAFLQQVDELRSRQDVAGLAVTRGRADLAARAAGSPGRALDLLSLSQLQQPAQRRLERLTQLTGSDARNVGLISGRLQGVRERLPGLAERRQLEFERDPSSQAFKDASLEFSKLQAEGDNLARALEQLADASNLNAGIQEKLARIEQEKESRLGLAERYATGEVGDLLKLNRGFSLAQVAAERGSLKGFSQTQRQEIVSSLRSAGSTTLFGVQGAPQADDLLRRLLEGTFSQLQLPAGLAAEEGSLRAQQVSNLELAEKAAGALATAQEQASKSFFSELGKSQNDFFSRLERFLKEDKLAGLTAERGGLAEKQADLEDLRTARGVLAGAGVGNDRELERLRGAQGDVTKFFDARKNLGRADRALRSRDATSLELIRSVAEEHQRNGGSITELLISKLQGVAGVSDREAANIAESGVASQLGYVSRLARENRVPLTDERLSGTAARLSLELEDPLKRERERVLREEVRPAEEKLRGQNLSPNAIFQTGEEKLGGAVKAFDGQSLENLDGRIEETSGAFRELTGRINELRDSLGLSALPQPKTPTPVVTSTGFALDPRHLATGGPIDFRPRGSDTVPAMLSPGEFVVRRESAQANKALLQRINDAKGPLYLAGGGPVPAGTRRVLSLLDNPSGDFRRQLDLVLTSPPDERDIWLRAIQLKYGFRSMEELEEALRGAVEERRVPAIAERPPAVAERGPARAEKRDPLFEAVVEYFKFFGDGEPPAVAERPPATAERGPARAEKFVPPAVAERPPARAQTRFEADEDKFRRDTTHVGLLFAQAREAKSRLPAARPLPENPFNILERITNEFAPEDKRDESSELRELDDRLSRLADQVGMRHQVGFAQSKLDSMTEGQFRTFSAAVLLSKGSTSFVGDPTAAMAKFGEGRQFLLQSRRNDSKEMEALRLKVAGDPASLAKIRKFERSQIEHNALGAIPDDVVLDSLRNLAADIDSRAALQAQADAGLVDPQEKLKPHPPSPLPSDPVKRRLAEIERERQARQAAFQKRLGEDRTEGGLIRFGRNRRPADGPAVAQGYNAVRRRVDEIRAERAARAAKFQEGVGGDKTEGGLISFRRHRPAVAEKAPASPAQVAQAVAGGVFDVPDVVGAPAGINPEALGIPNFLLKGGGQPQTPTPFKSADDARQATREVTFNQLNRNATADPFSVSAAVRQMLLAGDAEGAARAYRQAQFGGQLRSLRQRQLLGSSSFSHPFSGRPHLDPGQAGLFGGGVQTQQGFRDEGFQYALLDPRVRAAYERQLASRVQFQGRVFGFAEGGVVPGVGARDSVLGLLAPGEVILDRETSSRFGSDPLRNIQRFASGGVVGQPTPSPSFPRSSSPTTTGDAPDFSAFTRAASELAQGFNGFGQNVGTIQEAITAFGGTAQALADAISSMPRSLTGNFQHTVDVNLNGSEVLKEIMPGIKSMVTSQVNTQLQNVFRNQMPDAGVVV